MEPYKPEEEKQAQQQQNGQQKRNRNRKPKQDKGGEAGDGKQPQKKVFQVKK